MYDAPGSYIKQVVIDSKVVAKEKPPVYIGTEQKRLADQIIAEDDGTSDDKSEGYQQQMTQIWKSQIMYTVENWILKSSCRFHNLHATSFVFNCCKELVDLLLIVRLSGLQCIHYTNVRRLIA